MAIDDSIIFAIDSSMVDIIDRQIPNYLSTSDRWLKTVVDGSVQLYPVDSGAPTIRRDNFNIYLEPASINLVTHNIDLSDISWVKGSDVDVDPDNAIGTSNRLMADKLTFTGGDLSPSAQASQTIYKELELEVAKTYTLTGYLALGGGQFSQANTNVVQVTGEVADPGSAIYFLSDLNDAEGKYREFQITFTTTGQQIADVPAAIDDLEFDIVSFSGRTITVNLPGATDMISANDFAGGRLELINQAGDSLDYTIESHTAPTTEDGDFVITLGPTVNLDVTALTTSWLAFVLEADKVAVRVEVYSTSIAQILWGGVFLEPLPFPTSPIFQAEEIRNREGTTLTYRDSPIAGMDTFTFLLDIAEWRGDGNLVNLGNFSLAIESGQLVVRVDTVTINATIPSRAAVIVQVSTSAGLVKLYVNGVLDQSVALFGFTGDRDAVMTFTSAGVREYRRCFIFNTALLDGKAQVGDTAGDEIQEVFDNPNLLTVPPVAAEFVLPPITVPARQAPAASSMITSVGSGTVTVLAVDATDVNGSDSFSAGQPYTIIRGSLGNDHQVIATGIITAVNVGTSVLTVSDEGGALTGDLIYQGDITSPGRASARFPFEPIDEQLITLVSSDWLTLEEGSTSFSVGRALVRSKAYQALAEVSIEEVDAPGGRVRVDNASGIAANQLISQPKPGKEMIISPSCYFVALRYPVPDVKIGENNGLTPNAILLSNYSPEPVVVEPLVRVFM